MPAARQRRDRVGDLRPRRVEHADEAEELEVALDVVGVVAGVGRAATRRAKASTRSASRSIAAAAADAPLLRSSASVVRGRMTSAAPLTYATRSPPTRWTVVMRLRSE